MIRWRFFAVAVVFVTAAGWYNAAEPADKPRNPFNVEDVPDPQGKDVKEFAARVKLPGDAKDANAERWAGKPTGGKAGSLEGEWSSRWNGGSAGKDWISGTATVKAVGDRVFILYKDNTGTYLIEAKRDGKKLVDRYHNVPGGTDTTPWVGVVVDDERIDGIWKDGRWDLRRDLPPGKKNE
jgi:hypothetical protein